MRTVAAAATMVLLLTACAPDVTHPPLPTPAPSPPLPPPPPGHNDIASGKFRRPLSVADAERILRHTTIFAYGENHFPHSEAVAVIAQERDALATARRLGREGEGAGRLFAFCLLKHLESNQPTGLPGPERKDIEELAGELANVTTLIWFTQSDVTEELTVSAALIRIMNRRLWIDVVDDGRRRMRPGRTQ